jgi:hypothetical protein
MSLPPLCKEKSHESAYIPPSYTLSSDFHGAFGLRAGHKDG